MTHSSGRHRTSPERDGKTATGSAPSTATVVIGLDGSDSSWDAFWWACGEARRLGGRAVAVFVSPFPSAVSADTAALAGQVAGELAEQLRLQAERCATDQGVDITFVHSQGDPALELLRIAAANQANQIVVGRSTKARHRLAGSLGPRLIRRDKAPVVVVVP
jgi:nucleotide-binding universal stress UspA family protein